MPSQSAFPDACQLPLSSTSMQHFLQALHNTSCRIGVWGLRRTSRSRFASPPAWSVDPGSTQLTVFAWITAAVRAPCQRISVSIGPSRSVFTHFVGPESAQCTFLEQRSSLRILFVRQPRLRCQWRVFWP
ncbi:hypothetical protein NDU88_002221 [Pleurodeles waltl]|uniref:Uncharacterized protein n=1 Tax=Pleurodeles waltl TaxID=8319 RepID=A0AAV7U9B4_PLEWA|nr:hypothetical protein NDU88_002221 [Pleurodeles waltl]